MIDRMRSIAGLATISIGLLGCAAGPAATVLPTDPPVVASPAQASPTVATPQRPEPTTRIVESARHGYRIELPADWTMTEYDGTWESFDQFGLGVEVPGEDVIDSSDLQAFLVLNSMAIPDGMTADEWLTAFDAVVTPALPPECPGSPVPGTFAGQPAIVIEQECGGATIVGRSFTQAGRGYYVTTVAPSGGAAGPILEEMLASLSFPG